MSETAPEGLMEKLVSLCKRRGFVFPTAEKYGGLQGFWDWGPLGVELKNNIKREWWKRFVQERSDVVGLDSAIITNPIVWKKSGHLDGFSDPLIECKKCHRRYKYDELKNGKYSSVSDSEIDFTCPNCGNTTHTGIRQFHLLCKTSIGPIEDQGSVAYLRPETAQNIFVNYETVAGATRLKPPFGIAQIGKAFRNEITPGNFFFRSREFEQMELEFFVEKGTDEKWFDYWVSEVETFFTDFGIKKKHLRRFEQPKDELAHYSKATTDIEYHWPFDKGWGELTGIANRTDFDLKAHGLGGENPPYVIEPSFGVERAALAFLLDAFDEVKGGRSTTTESVKETEMVLRLDKRLAPIKIAVLPLSKKEELSSVAQTIAGELRKQWMVQYDETASIGKRYRRQDEIGTPYCVTMDFDSLEDKKVTVRDRDTMEQERVRQDDLVAYFTKAFV